MLYQFLPRLSDDEYTSLEKSIREHGIQVPIVVDENGSVIDGHHRKEIADRLQKPFASVVFAWIMQGRSVEQRAALSKAVVGELADMFPRLSRIAMNVAEFERATYFNRAMIR